MKIENLDGIELILIKKIENYLIKYYKALKIIVFDFPRASDSGKIISSAVLIEDTKSDHLKTTFGGKLKEVELSN